MSSTKAGGTSYKYELADVNRVKVGQFTYDAYGNVTASSGTTTTLKYRGEYQDGETGYIYLRARYYDPATAQVLTRDPLVHISRSPYGYANQSPLNYTDPSGLIVPVVVAAWAVVEVALAVADAYSTYSTLADGCATGTEKSVSMGLLVVGMVAPGGGYSTAGKVVQQGHRTGRGKNHLTFDPRAGGSHTTFRRDDVGRIVHYQTWIENPRNPNGFDAGPRFDAIGRPHIQKGTNVEVPPPHVQGKGIPGGVRPARPDEIPSGW